MSCALYLQVAEVVSQLQVG